MDPVPAIVGALVALVLSVLALLLTGAKGARPLGRWVAAVLPMGAVFTALLVVGESVDLPPRAFLDWALLAGVAGLVLGLVASVGARQQWLVGLAVAGVAGAVFTLGTESLHERYWGGEVLPWAAALTGTVLANYLARCGAASMGRSTEALLATALAALAAAPALGLSGTSVSALLAGALSASAGILGMVGLHLAGFRERIPGLARATAPGHSLLLGGLMANGVLYAETPRSAGLLILLAPLVTLVPGRGLAMAGIRLVVVVSLVAWAVALSKGEPNPYAGY